MTLLRSKSLTLILMAAGALTAAAQTTSTDRAEVSKITIKPVAAILRAPVTEVNAPASDYDAITNTTRLGVQTSQPLSLTLDDAIRRALANNNDIEVSRTAERIQE